MPEKVISTIDSRPDLAVATPPDLHTDSVTIPVKLCNLPPLNSIANQVLSMSADEDVDLQRLASIVEADPAFAAEVLLLANSSLFGFPSRMHVLRHAVAVLGLDRIKAVAVTVAMRAFLSGGGPLVRQIWRHSAACAIIAEEISPIFDISGDRAYTSAIMHDIGRLGLLKSYPREMTPPLSAEYADPTAVLVAERAAINVDHGTAGAWLVKTWAFPPTFVEICEHHHDPLHPHDSALLQVIKLSCRMADSLGFSAVRYKTSASYRDLLPARETHAKPEEFPSEENLRANVETRLAVFEQ
ncbi:MAG: HDOD domain-containing protein [Acidobacteriia bacterium]|nr:HDOD domain-containing protein [Terriglobia bacterium]